ncbi:AAA family ATPase [Candidatus Poribacteria bacterium]|nr:AAA family ATPase [Candidatus Poribacteria bacterium]
MIKSLTLRNYKGFSNTTIEFSNITCIVGENSTGKSTIIRAIQDLLTSDNPISQNDCKVGINDNNTTSLLLALQNGRNRSKNIKNVERGDDNPVPECITSISPIATSYNFTVANNSYYDQPIKNHNIGDIAWRNILSDCDFTLRTAAESITSGSSAKRFNNQHTLEVSKKFTNTFNDMLKDSNRQYEFEVFFERNGDNLAVQLLNSYRVRNNESNEESPQVDLEHESVGFQTLITLCSYRFNDQDKSEKIFVMDEPFTNIHPKAQRHVSRMLQSLSQSFQIIYATHSPHLLPERDKVQCTLTEAAGDLSICKFEEYPLNLFYDLSPLALDTVEEIKRSDSAINVIPEGATDDKIYQSLFKIEEISDKIDIIDMGGSGNLENRIRSFATIDKPSLFILDPNEEVKKLGRSRELIAKYDHLFLLELSYQKDNHVKKGIENLIPNHIIEKAYKELENVVQILTKQYHGEEPTEQYLVLQKPDLADFFVNEAEDDDYEFFRPVIDKITEIRKNLEYRL